MSDARDGITDALIGTTASPRPRCCRGCRIDVAVQVLTELSLHGYVVVPVTLVHNAEAAAEQLRREATCCDVCGPASDPVGDALTASLERHKATDPIAVLRRANEQGGT